MAREVAVTGEVRAAVGGEVAGAARAKAGEATAMVVVATVEAKVEAVKEMARRVGVQGAGDGEAKVDVGAETEGPACQAHVVEVAAAVARAATFRAIRRT